MRSTFTTSEARLMEPVTPRRIVASAIWHRGTVLPAAPALVRLEDLLPRPGQEQTVWVCGYALSEEATLDLLWYPPYSEQNGWDDQPSEIELSQIVSGRVRRIQPPAATESAARSSDTDEVACKISIQQRVPLLSCVRALSRAPPAAALSMPTRMRYENWRQVHWCGAAEIRGFIYLSALAGEGLWCRAEGGGPHPRLSLLRSFFRGGFGRGARSDTGSRTNRSSR